MHSEDIKFCVRTAKLLATRSRATRAKVGCVVWDKKKRTIVGIGFNGTFPGEDNTMESNGKTLPTVIHAEVNAIGKVGWFVRRRSVLFVTHSPCYNCAGEIVKSGIREVYYVEPYGDARGLQYLSSKGIKVRRILWDNL